MTNQVTYLGGRRMRNALITFGVLTAIAANTINAQPLNGQVELIGAITRPVHSKTVEAVDARLVAANQLTLSAVIDRLNIPNKAVQDLLERKVMDLNLASSIGTLRLDASTGRLSLHHHLNPLLVSTDEIDVVLESFGQRVAKYQALFAKLRLSSAIK